ncbi:chromosome-associated kinesin KIF4A-like [Cylas formicarius]|uniref:chromosome-associated kinesin KIF4A-like n=1 Tax=Cylas formicarius TaxID=197179 RepID=UPI002958A70A|nr:chromosome-associated kinesin KIF4A-like [Cylas formicarius]
MNGNDTCSVKVAVRVRPLVPFEISRGCKEVLEIVPENEQILVRPIHKPFTFNYVLGVDSTQVDLYERCVEPLLQNLFEGFNVTILAYGQNGSGKTHSMGTAYQGEDHAGVIPRAVKHIFDYIKHNLSIDFTVSVSFIELYNERIFDLLSDKPRDQCRLEIREDVKGNILIAKLTETIVESATQLLDILTKGSNGRATAATSMNLHSSRSHAIFTINIAMQHKFERNQNKNAKLHLVDLAGSERPKKTGAVGSTFKEGVNINKGLFVLGNVINCLGNNKSQQSFVPYRDSNLTRLLKDSLGGNSMLLMIACVSPADYNLEETLSTLRYADSARKIKNKPVINQGLSLLQLERVKSKTEMRELTRVEQQDQKKQTEITKIKVMHANQQNVLKWKFEEAAALNKRLQQTLILRKQVQDSKFNGKPDKIGPLVKCGHNFTSVRENFHFFDVILVFNRIFRSGGLIKDVGDQITEEDFYSEAVTYTGEGSRARSIKILNMIDRAILQQQLDELMKNPKTAESNETKTIKDDIELRSVQIQDLQLKLLDFDKEKPKTRFDRIQSMAEAKYALKLLFEQAEEFFKKFVQCKNKCSELMEINKVLSEKNERDAHTLKLTEDKYRDILSNQQQVYEEKVAILLRQLRGIENGSQNGDSGLSRCQTQKELIEKQEKQIEEQQKLINKLKNKLEENEKANLENVPISQNSRKRNKSTVVESIEEDDKLAEPIDASEPEDSFGDDLINDPDWRKTPLGKRVIAKKKKIIKQSQISVQGQNGDSGLSRCQTQKELIEKQEKQIEEQQKLINKLKNKLEENEKANLENVPISQNSRKRNKSTVVESIEEDDKLAEPIDASEPEDSFGDDLINDPDWRKTPLGKRVIAKKKKIIKQSQISVQGQNGDSGLSRCQTQKELIEKQEKQIEEQQKLINKLKNKLEENEKANLENVPISQNSRKRNKSTVVESIEEDDKLAEPIDASEPEDSFGDDLINDPDWRKTPLGKRVIAKKKKIIKQSQISVQDLRRGRTRLLNDGCTCKTKCNSVRCGCRKANKICMGTCKCDASVCENRTSSSTNAEVD